MPNMTLEQVALMDERNKSCRYVGGCPNPPTVVMKDTVLDTGDYAFCDEHFRIIHEEGMGLAMKLLREHFGGEPR